MSPGVLVIGLWRVVRPPKKYPSDRQDLHEWRVGTSALILFIGLWIMLHTLWVSGLIGIVTFGYIGSAPYVNATELENAKQEIIQSSVARGIKRTEQIEALTADTKSNGLSMMEFRLDRLHDKFCMADATDNQTAVLLIEEMLRTDQADYRTASEGPNYPLLPCL